MSDEIQESKRVRIDESRLVPSNVNSGGALVEASTKKASLLSSSTIALSGHESTVYSIAFSPSGYSLASASMDSKICESIIYFIIYFIVFIF